MYSELPPTLPKLPPTYVTLQPLRCGANRNIDSGSPVPSPGQWLVTVSILIRACPEGFGGQVLPSSPEVTRTAAFIVAFPKLPPVLVLMDVLSYDSHL